MAKENQNVAKATLQDVYNKYAGNIKNGEKTHKLDTAKKFTIKFTEDFKLFKKGQGIVVSQVAMDYYLLNKVAEEVK